MRILALDVGERRIGVAAADSETRVALPVGVLERTELLADAAAIARLVEEQKAEALVLGLPISLNGSLGPQAQLVRAFGDKLAGRLDLPVEYWDERLSTVEAQHRLTPPTKHAGQRKGHRLTKARRSPGTVDAMAAAIILQSYLDRKAGGTQPPAQA